MEQKQPTRLWSPQSRRESNLTARQSRAKNRIAVLALSATMILGGLAIPRPAKAGPQGKKDYLTDAESDKIRDAMAPGDRIKIYLSFADDRLKKFQYEISRTTPEPRRDEMLNVLLNAYVGCVDDAADQIEIAREKQSDIHLELKEFATKGKEFQSYLQKIDKNTPYYDSYSDTLQDAVEGTQEALEDVAGAQKELSPAPVRRKPS
ncbi:MAG: hypothetical protein WBS18_09125 [Candidatus Acidiferrales bacterium]